MKKILLLFTSLVMTVLVYGSDNDYQNGRFSNYGEWQNLTAGFTRDTTTEAVLIKAEIAAEGTMVHAVWTARDERNRDKGPAIWYCHTGEGDGHLMNTQKAIYYRNTTDWDGYSNMMAVSGDNIYIIAADRSGKGEKAKLTCLVSNDGGENFTPVVVENQFKADYQYVQEYIIRADGPNVVIAGLHYLYQADALYVYRSTDYGKTFDRMEIDKPQSVQHLSDLQMKGDRWALMWYHEYWSNGLKDGRVYVQTGNMTSENVETSQLAPDLDGNETFRCLVNKQYGGSGDDYNFHPMMTITGENTLHVLFTGQNEFEEGETSINIRQTLYIRSDDFGKTWNKSVRIPDATDAQSTLVAKGQNVYAIVGDGYNRWIAYSNDNGNTWKANKTMCYGSTQGKNFDSPRSYHLVLDPTDETGNTAWYIGSRWLTVQTKDGFNSLSYASRLDGNLRNNIPHSRGCQFSPLLAIDSNGTNHWLMRDFIGEGTRNVGQLYYRKETPEIENGQDNVALHIIEKKDTEVQNRVVIPLRPSLQLDSAITISFWLRLGELEAYTNLISLASNTSRTDGDAQVGGPFEPTVPGFSIGLESRKDAYNRETGEWDGIRAQVKAYLNTDLSSDGRGTTLFTSSKYDENVWQIADSNMWYHVCFTWDGRQYGENMHLYLNGIPLASGSLMGTLEFGSNPIVIGNTSHTNRYDYEWWMEDLKIWNRAISYEEIKELACCQFKFGVKKGLVGDYEFNYTLKDFSGNGNDALAQLNLDFDTYGSPTLSRPPHLGNYEETKQNMILAKDVSGQIISFTDNPMRSDNGKHAVYWFFDDKPSGESNSGSVKPSDVHLYSTPGTYHPIMIANLGDIYIPDFQEFVVGGLHKVEPAKGGQVQHFPLTIYGNYNWDKNTNVRLHREGQEDIIGTWTLREGPDESHMVGLDNLHSAYFDLMDAAVGKWDVIVGEDTLKSSFTVEPYEQPDVWARNSCPLAILAGENKRFEIEYGNHSNVDAYNVPLFFYVSSTSKTKSSPNAMDREIRFSFEIPIQRYPSGTDAEWKAALNSMGDKITFYSDKKNIYGDEYHYMDCYPILIPRIPAKTTVTIRADVESDADFDFVWSMGKPWGPLWYDEKDEPQFYDDEIDDILNGKYRRFNNKQLDCIMRYLGWGFMDGTIGNIPYVGCLYNAGKTGLIFLADEKSEMWDNLFTNSLSTLVSCGLEANPLGWAARATTIVGQIFNAAMVLQSADACNALAGDDKHVRVVNSYDPNEMEGPWGFGDEHFMKPAPEMYYKTSFENKSEATAPAHRVFVTDTLDANLYDLESFSFASFGWADTIIDILGQNMQEFVQDVVLTDKEMVVRVSGKFDKETGIASWNFLTLDKDLNIEEDALRGFLVPNNANHEGEGFVTFNINHKSDLGNGAQVKNKATIIFDYNEPIQTNVWSNTLDADNPTSKAVSATLNDEGKIVVAWDAQDGTSGVATIDLYKSEDGGAFEFVGRYPAADLSATLDLEAEKTYAFATTSRDHVGWQEQKAVSDLTKEAQYTPSQSTGLGNDQMEKCENAKILRDGQLLILRGDKVYTTTGQEVK